MPVIFTKKQEEIGWPSTVPKASDTIAYNHIVEKINHYPVSPRINNANTNVPSLIVQPPADHSDLTLFD